MQNWLPWLPRPRHWLNALALMLLMAGLQFVSSYLGWLLNWLIGLLPRFGYALVVLAFLAPIGLIAVLHHWLDRGLDRWFPDTQLPELSTTSGFFPSLMSWWEGLYGWMVNYLATLLAAIVLSILFPNPNVDAYSISFLAQLQPILLVPFTVRTVIAAYLYQFESAVKQHLIAVGAGRSG